MDASGPVSFLFQRQFFVPAVALVIFLFFCVLIATKISTVIQVVRQVIWYRNYTSLDKNSIWTELFTIFPAFPYCYNIRESRLKHRLERYSMISRHEKPSVIWLGPVTFSLLDNWESIEDLNQAKPERKGHSYGFIDPALKNGLIGSNDTKWRMLRRVYLAVLKKGNLESYFPTMGKELDTINQELHDLCIGNQLVVSDLRELTIHISYDITGPLVLGRKLNFFRNKDKPNSWGKIFVSRNLQVFQRVVNIALWNDFIFYNLSSPGKFYRSRERKTKSYIYAIVDELYEEWKTNGNGDKISEPGYTSFLNNFFYYFFKKPISGNTWKFTLDELRLEAVHSVVAGIETIANSSQWALYALGCHPEYQEKVFQELQGLSCDLSSPSNLDVLKNATFLEQCIKESLRHFSTVPIISRELTEDVMINGQKFYKGTEMVINVYQLHHDPEVFDTPDEFRPERFGPDAKRIPAGAYIPFGFGTRDCIGRHLAIMGVKLIVSSIIRDFKIQSKVFYNELNLEFLLNLESVEPLEVTLVRRRPIN